MGLSVEGLLGSVYLFFTHISDNNMALRTPPLFPHDTTMVTAHFKFYYHYDGGCRPVLVGDAAMNSGGDDNGRPVLVGDAAMNIGGDDNPAGASEGPLSSPPRFMAASLTRTGRPIVLGWSRAFVSKSTQV